MAKIFIAFGGGENQNTSIEKLQQIEDVELLNLENYSIQELQDYLKEKEITLPHPQIEFEGYNFWARNVLDES